MDQERGVSTTAVFDGQELVARCMGNVEFACRILAKFQARLHEDLGKLEGASEAGNADAVATVAHRLKGAAANVAAHALRDRAATIEDLARQQNLAAIVFHLEELRRECVSFGESVSALSAEAGCNPTSTESIPCESW